MTTAQVRALRAATEDHVERALDAGGFDGDGYAPDVMLEIFNLILDEVLGEEEE